MEIMNHRALLMPPRKVTPDTFLVLVGALSLFAGALAVSLPFLG